MTSSSATSRNGSRRARAPILNDMDNKVSASAVAEELGTSVPRVMRAAKRLGLDSRTGRGRLALTPDQVGQLRRELGRTEWIFGLSTTEVAALAALSRAPLGLPSARAVAVQAGLSPTAASRAIKSLLNQELVLQAPELIVAGRPRQVRMLRANRRSPRYSEIAPRLRRVIPPRRPREERVPPRLAHLFWNTNPTQLEVAHGGPYIARRLLRTLDPAGLAWGARNLRADDWLRASKARGLDAATKALAHNLAAGNEQ